MKPEERKPLGSNLNALVQDLVRMADLQLQLLKLDMVQFWSESRISVLIAGSAALAILGAMPVLLLGVAGTLQSLAGLSPQLAQVIVSVVIILVGGLLLRGSLMTVSEASKSLKRSQEEFQNNLTWMREVLQQEE